MAAEGFLSYSVSELLCHPMVSYGTEFALLKFKFVQRQKDGESFIGFHVNQTEAGYMTAEMEAKVSYQHA